MLSRPSGRGVPPNPGWVGTSTRAGSRVALAPAAGSDDPGERVGYATEVLHTGILARQSAVRAMIAASVTRPDVAATRPGHRFALIEHALAPLAGADPGVLAQLKRAWPS